jgi:hypothetical protein
MKFGTGSKYKFVGQIFLIFVISQYNPYFTWSSNHLSWNGLLYKEIGTKYCIVFMKICILHFKPLIMVRIFN